MKILILFLTIVYLAFLVNEAKNADSDRKKLSHIVHVNAIRGKSSVSRLIEAGLRAGGFNVFCKTTDTVPMTIDTKGIESPIIRRGRSNIKEQLRIMRMAAEDGADVLVIECMAVDPALQFVCQHKMLKADIGVITNVRLDHTEEMGATLDGICNSLCNTVPKSGVVFTADNDYFAAIKKHAESLSSKAILSDTENCHEQDIDFTENVALAIEVCSYLGVERDVALRGMANYKRDPYALSIYTLCGGAVFINGLSINDPDSSFGVWDMLKNKHKFSDKHLILLINNRPDRGYRTEHMLVLTERLLPDEVWLLGASQRVVSRKISKLPKSSVVRCFKTADELPLNETNGETVIFAAGNNCKSRTPSYETGKRGGKAICIIISFYWVLLSAFFSTNLPDIHLPDL